MANWADLLPDLLERISDFCIIPGYVLRMHSVCKSWWSILKNSIHHPELPLLMMLPNNKEEEEGAGDPDARVFFSLSKQKIQTIPLPEMGGKRCCGSFQNGWLMFVDLKLDICLFHPWSKKKIHLPHQSTFEKQNYVENGFSMEDIRDLHIVKAALSDDANVVVVVSGLGHLGFCRIGDNAYTHIDCSYMDDVVYYKGQFYAIDHAFGLWLLHIEDGFHPHGEKLAKIPNPVPIDKLFYGYLVPDVLTDSMFVILRALNDLDAHKTIHFDIYNVSLEEGTHDKTLKKYTKLESLGDRVLFLGHNSPMIAMASQFLGFKGNCIYFADNIMQGYYECSYGCRDSGVFSVEDGTVKLLFADRFHPMLSPPLWISTPPYSSQRDFGEELCLDETNDISV